MAKAERRGKLSEIPEERRLLYDSYYQATWPRVQTKAEKLVKAHDSHRSNGSCALEVDIDEVVNQGFIRVLFDPKHCPDRDAFTLDMFRQMEGFLSEQRRLASSNRERHEPIDDVEPQASSVIAFPDVRIDEAHEQHRRLEAAHAAVAALRPQWLRLFELSRQNLGNDEISPIVGRTPDQLNSDRHRLHAFLVRHFTPETEHE